MLMPLLIFRHAMPCCQLIDISLSPLAAADCH